MFEGFPSLSSSRCIETYIPTFTPNFYPTDLLFDKVSFIPLWVLKRGSEICWPTNGKGSRPSPDFKVRELLHFISWRPGPLWYERLPFPWHDFIPFNPLIYVWLQFRESAKGDEPTVLRGSVYVYVCICVCVSCILLERSL